MANSLSFANLAPSLAHLPTTPLAPGESAARMATGGQRPRQVARMSTGPAPGARRQAIINRRNIARSAAARSRLDLDFEWPAEAIIGESLLRFEIKFADSWVTPAEWRFWRHEVRRRHCQDQLGNRAYARTLGFSLNALVDPEYPDFAVIWFNTSS
ncbi:hypothetical protein P7C70_g1629, partial [Phenoliferia sp. Uapishka_3]